MRLINDFPEEMSVLVNGRSYRLLPGQERLIRVSAGDYSLELLQFPGERRSGELTAGPRRRLPILRYCTTTMLFSCEGARSTSAVRWPVSKSPAPGPTPTWSSIRATKVTPRSGR